MECPSCNAELSEVVKHGVVIDHCPGCGGIWLDKGEMAKIVGQLKQAEAALDEEFRPLWKAKKEYQDTYKYKKKSTLGKVFELFD